MLVNICVKVDSPWLPNGALRKALDQTEKSLEEVVANNFYMDDFICSLSNEESLIKFPLAFISSVKICGFRLTKWISNSKVILDNFPSSIFKTSLI